MTAGAEEIEGYDSSTGVHGNGHAHCSTSRAVRHGVVQEQGQKVVTKVGISKSKRSLVIVRRLCKEASMVTSCC